MPQWFNPSNPLLQIVPVEQMPTPPERVESLKAGMLSASAATLIFTALLAIHQLLAQLLSMGIVASLTAGSWLSLGCSLGAAAISGFLFGVTYRYVIRQDTNPQLQSGAVLAFGLVRGLAQVDTGWGLTNTVVPFVGMAAESLLMFSCDRIVLDQALRRGWVKPFNTDLPAP